MNMEIMIVSVFFSFIEAKSGQMPEMFYIFQN